MRYRTAFIVSAIALVASFVVPYVFVHGLSWILHRVGAFAGQGGFALGLTVLLGGEWLVGMFWGVALFTPFCALLQSLDPGRLAWA